MEFLFILGIVYVILVLILLTSFIYNLFTKNKRHWDFTIALLIVITLINVYGKHQFIKNQILEDEMYKDYVLSQAYETDKTDCSSIPIILANLSSCDSKEVLVSGMVKEVKFRTSQRGNDYTTFILTDGYYDYNPNYGITVYINSHKSLTENEMIQVRGTYHQVKEVSGYTFYNQIDAVEFTDYD